MAVLAIDQGTSGTKAVVVEPDGAVLAFAEVPVHPDYRGGGAVEQDPGDLLSSVLEAGRRAVASAGASIEVVALANQGETVLAWDPRSGKPLSRAIVWQDRRAESICRPIADRGAAFAARTGLVLSPYFSAPKMAWLRANVTRDGVVTTSDAWLLHQLTGRFVTDVSTASRSLVFDLDALRWAPDLLTWFDLARESLPEIAANDVVVGETAAFGGAIPVGGLIVDQQAALLAEGCLAAGEAKCTYGTGAFLLANTGSAAPRSGNGLTTSVAWQVRGETAFCLDGQVYTVSSALRWLRDIGVISDVKTIDQVAAGSSDGVMFVPSLAGLAAPYWRPDARATFTGLTLATTRGALVRAVIEGVAAQVAVLAEVFAPDLGRPLDALRVDGGLVASRALMQAQADVLQRPVEVYASPHATALGAAALGRLSIEPARTLADAVWPWTPAAVYEPVWSADRAAAFLGQWRACVDQSIAAVP